MPLDNLYGVLVGGIIRAFCGLCFGAFSWIIYDKIMCSVSLKSQKMMLTILEVLIYAIVIPAIIFWSADFGVVISMLLLMVILFPIVLSGKSYISNLFKSKIFKHCGSLSLAIYLNHWVGYRVVKHVYSGQRYVYCVSLLLIVTLVTCVVYYILIFLIKYIWNKKLKYIFLNNP